MNNEKRQWLDLGFPWLIAGCIFLLFMGGKLSTLVYPVSLVVFAEDEAQLIQRMQNFARERQIYFLSELVGAWRV